MKLYEYDPTGTSPNNLVVDERNTPSYIYGNVYKTVVFKHGPAYCNNEFFVSFIKNGIKRQGMEGRDYTFILPYTSLQVIVGKIAYGGISFIAHEVDEVILRYQTIGGPWVNNYKDTYRKMYNNNYNPRLVHYDEIVVAQEKLPPTKHDVGFDDLYEFDMVLDKLNEIVAVAATRKNPTIIDYLSRDRDVEITALRSEVMELRMELSRK